MLRKYTPDPSHVVDWGKIEVDKDGTFEEGPVCIVDSRDQVLQCKIVRLVRVLYSNIHFLTNFLQILLYCLYKESFCIKRLRIHFII